MGSVSTEGEETLLLVTGTVFARGKRLLAQPSGRLRGARICSVSVSGGLARPSCTAQAAIWARESKLSLRRMWVSW
jgi:hypothetical protein